MLDIIKKKVSWLSLCHLSYLHNLLLFFWIGGLNLEDALILIHNIYRIAVFCSK
jgi:hypothetical protein